MHGGKLKFENLNYKKAIQGDVNFPLALEKLRKGTFRTIDMEESMVIVEFSDQEVKYGFSELDQVRGRRLAAFVNMNIRRRLAYKGGPGAGRGARPSTPTTARRSRAITTSP